MALIILTMLGTSTTYLTLSISTSATLDWDNGAYHIYRRIGMAQLFLPTINVGIIRIHLAIPVLICAITAVHSKRYHCPLACMDPISDRHARHSKEATNFHLSCGVTTWICW